MADDMSNNNFGSTLHHSHVIRDYNKIKNNEVLINQLDSIGLFFFLPQHCFFYQTQSLIRINILFPGPPKDCFALCFEPLREEEQPFRLRRGILFEIYSLAGNSK